MGQLPKVITENNGSGAMAGGTAAGCWRKDAVLGAVRLSSKGDSLESRSSEAVNPEPLPPLMSARAPALAGTAIPNSSTPTTDVPEVDRRT